MKSRFRLFVAACLAIALLASIFLRPTVASSTLSDSRINQLEFQVRSLQTQINQLQGRSSPSSPSNPTASYPDLASPPGELSIDAQFDNLATLVIEINQRVLKLEEQTAE